MRDGIGTVSWLQSHHNDNDVNGGSGQRGGLLSHVVQHALSAAMGGVEEGATGLAAEIAEVCGQLVCNTHGIEHDDQVCVRNRGFHGSLCGVLLT